MRRLLASVLLISVFLAASEAKAGDIQGPARFCGYSPVIDLVEGERIVTLEGGIHGGAFLWTGPFGKLTVYGIGWASRPKGRLREAPTMKGHAMFEQRRTKGEFVVAIWNKAHGAAYFSSGESLTKQQIAAINRVDLFNEGEEPKGCSLRTIFAWE